MRIGALDLGSNSFHGLVADVSRRGAEITKVWSQKETLRLGASVAAYGCVPAPAFARAVASVSAMAAAARELGLDRLTIVGTSALREARNGAELAQAIERAVGCPVEIVSGDAEADLVYRGARACMPDLPARSCVVDLGGGSAEIAVGEHGRLLHAESLPLGFLRLGEKLGRGGPPAGPDFRTRLNDHVATIAARSLPAIRAREPRAWVLSGGTARALGKLSPTGDVISRYTLDKLAREIAELTPEALAARGVDQTRAAGFDLALAVIVELLDGLGAHAARISVGGLREGLVLREYWLASAVPSTPSPPLWRADGTPPHNDFRYCTSSFFSASLRPSPKNSS